MKSGWEEKRFNYFALSIKDLLEAREAYHVHLSNLPNVVATALGRYRIRRDDSNFVDPRSTSKNVRAKARTLANSSVTDWSWPCILVFVDKWITEQDLKPGQKIPDFLYLPDGRIVPTCTILIHEYDVSTSSNFPVVFSDQFYGGSYLILSDVQNKEHLATVGCLVTDGNLVYALTNKHVTGEINDNEKSQEIFTIIQGQRVRIGTTYRKQAGKKLFEEVYKGWSGRYSYSTIDAGLIKLDDITQWTSQIYGIGNIGEPIDLNINTMSLYLIGYPVRAQGGASGEMLGEIQGLFYRYKSIGGFDYVSDLLIGPRDEKSSVMTKHGDSGTLWFYDPEPLNKPDGLMISEKAKEYRPIALQWGGQQVIEEGNMKVTSFALATCLSTICRELDVDVFRGWNTGYNDYWGETGHYKVASTACVLISDPKLKELMNSNLDNISFDDDDIAAGQIKREYAPLADVPDLVWKTTRRNIENPNHFADMDAPGTDTFEGKTLFDITLDKKNIDIGVWDNFYDSVGEHASRGTLPFRVWQIYNEMVKFLKSEDISRFVCAAGILSHYVGDACQPLHMSRFYDGNDRQSKGVHTKYETNMLDKYSTEIVAGVNSYVADFQAVADIESGRAAAISVIDLMRRSYEKLSPMEIIDVYKSSGHNVDEMFSKLGKTTCALMGEGSKTLAALWESAWKQGNGNNINAEMAKIPQDLLQTYYDDKHGTTFLESYTIKNPRFALALNDLH
jgi:hypothetical protein